MKEDPYKSISRNSDGSPCLFTEVDGIRVTWETTGNCNLGCPHCCTNAVKFSKSPEKADATLEESKSIIDQFAENNITSVYVSGGEPLTWRPVYQVLQYASEKRIFTSLATNGSCINPVTGNLLARSNVGKVLVSLDSHLPHIHDAFRNVPGSYAAASNAIRILSDAGIFVRVGHVVWRDSVDYIEDFADSVVRLGADEIAYNWLIPAGRAKQNPEIMVPLKRYDEVGERLSKLKKAMSEKIIVSYHRFAPTNPSYNCMGGNKFLQITSSGHVTPCSWVEKLMPEYVSRGTLENSSLAQLSRGEEIRAFRDMVERRTLMFGPGCPAMCYVFNGTAMSKDPLLK